MDVLDFYNDTRVKFPEITEKADKKHIEMWGEINPEFAYSWFESLANALNAEMFRGVDPSKHKELFNYISARFKTGSEKVKNCIDVSFAENLFWKVPGLKAKPYWVLFPSNLRELYVKFHGKEPL